MAPLIQALIGGASMGIAVALIVAAYMGESPSPYIGLGGDSVSPERVKVLGEVTVNRRFEITRDTVMFITRSMVSGTCPKNCEIIDLPSGYLDSAPGVYERGRKQIIPSIATPGPWVLTFSVKWEDRFGRTFTYPLVPLAIEVIP